MYNEYDGVHSTPHNDRFTNEEIHIAERTEERGNNGRMSKNTGRATKIAAFAVGALAIGAITAGVIAASTGGGSNASSARQRANETVENRIVGPMYDKYYGGRNGMPENYRDAKRMANRHHEDGRRYTYRDMDFGVGHGALNQDMNMSQYGHNGSAWSGNILGDGLNLHMGNPTHTMAVGQPTPEVKREARPARQMTPEARKAERAARITPEGKKQCAPGQACVVTPQTTPTPQQAPQVKPACADYNPTPTPQPQQTRTSHVYNPVPQTPTPQVKTA